MASGLNPLRIRGLAMRPNVALLAKLITLAFLVSGQLNGLPRHFVPFIDAFRHAGSPTTFHRVLQLVFVAAAVSLFLNRWMRAACVVLGGVILVGIASSMSYFENNRAFTGFVLLLAGLQDPESEPYLLRWQVVLLYGAAAFNKWRQADWRDGQFFIAWFGTMHHTLWLKVTGVLPAAAVATVASWASMLTETALAIGFSVRRLYPYAIWLGLAFHATLALAVNRSFGMFWFAASCVYLAFVDWPDEPLAVRLGTDRAGRVASGLARRLDVDGGFSWTATSNHTTELDRRATTYRGWDAVARIFLFTPASAFAVVLLASAPRSQPRVPALVELACLLAFALAAASRSLTRPRAATL